MCHLMVLVGVGVTTLSPPPTCSPPPPSPPPSPPPPSSHSHLVAKMRRVFEQVMLVDGTRRMRGDIIQKTLKVSDSCLLLQF